MKNKTLLLIFLLFLVLATCGTVAAMDNSTDRISISTDGNQSNGESSNPSISADGRYVAFTSYANNLVPDDTNGVSDIFVRDTVLNTTELVSISSTGEEGNGNSKDPAISADGRYVTFASYASNLVLGDTNGYYDIFIRDRLLGITKRISITNTYGESNGDSNEPAISADSRFIVFSSYATNLVPQDNNRKGDIFLYNNDSGQITRLTVSNNDNEANGNSKNPTISADGNLIAFVSSANNLVENDTNTYWGVYTYNQTSNLIEKVDTLNISDNFKNPSISANGSYLTFTTNGRSLYIYNTISKTTEVVEILLNGEPNFMTSDPSISWDGRYIAVSCAHHSISDTIDLWINIYIYDQFFKTLKLITSSINGEPLFYSSYQPSISADGHTVAFTSISDELVSDDNNNYKDIFVYSEDYPLNAAINPDTTKSGDIITVQVSPNPNIENVTANILGNSYSLIKGSNGLWFLSYLVPPLADGFYPVELTVTNRTSNQRNVSLGFNVDNTAPLISGTVTPNLVKSGYNVSIDAFTSSDTTNVTALILGTKFDLYNLAMGWNLPYLIPNIPDGTYQILLTATDKAGNQNTTFLYFTVDNTPPVLSGLVTPDTVKTYNNLTIIATSNSDTISISAIILDHTYDLIKQSDSTWILKYSVPYIPNGNYPVVLTATDRISNEKTISLSFNVINPLDDQAPVIYGNITHSDMMYGKFPSSPWVSFLAFTDPDTINVTASVLNKEYVLFRQEDGSWASKYSSWLAEGNYTGLFTAYDWSGNQGTQTVNFTIKNISPILNYTMSPYMFPKIKSGDTIILTINVSPDPSEIYIYTPSGYQYPEKQANGSWLLNYTVPNLYDGYKSLHICCLFSINWVYPDSEMLVDRFTGFTVDNTPPFLSVSVTPTIIKSGDQLEISCTTQSDYHPDDTVKVTTTICGNTINLNLINTYLYWSNSKSISFWNIKTIIPNLPDGIYPILITATDDMGNQNRKLMNLTVDNTPPILTATISPNRLMYFDLSRPITSIIAQSSSDTKEIHAYLEDHSEYIFEFSNPNWILELNLPYLIPLGTYVAKIKAFDYAGNEAESSVMYYVYQNLNVKNPLTKPSAPGSSNNQPADGSSSTDSPSSESSSTESSSTESTTISSSEREENGGILSSSDILRLFFESTDIAKILAVALFIALVFGVLFSVLGTYMIIIGVLALFSLFGIFAIFVGIILVFAAIICFLLALILIFTILPMLLQREQ